MHLFKLHIEVMPCGGYHSALQPPGGFHVDVYRRVPPVSTGHERFQYAAKEVDSLLHSYRVHGPSYHSGYYRFGSGGFDLSKEGGINLAYAGTET